MKVLKNLRKVAHVNVFSAITKNIMLLLFRGKMIDVSHSPYSTSFIPAAECGVPIKSRFINRFIHIGTLYVVKIRKPCLVSAISFNQQSRFLSIFQPSGAVHVK